MLREALVLALSGGLSAEGADVGRKVGFEEVGVEEVDGPHTGYSFAEKTRFIGSLR